VFELVTSVVRMIAIAFYDRDYVDDDEDWFNDDD
jgi:hypothetical protein